MDAPLLLEERLGDPREIAASARSAYDRRSFAGRHPVLTFAIAPVFAVVGTVLGMLVLAWLTVWLAGMTSAQLQEQTTPPTTLQLAVVHCVVWVVRLTPFVVIAGWFSRVGRRIHRPRWG